MSSRGWGLTSHHVEIFTLLDGGLRDGGWAGEGRPKGVTRWRSCPA